MASYPRMDFVKDAIRTLRSAAFPIYVVPPQLWHGDVLVGGVTGEATRPLAIHMRYDDDLMLERPPRRIQISSTGAELMSKRAPSENFLLWEHSYHSTIINFVYNITTDRFPERPIPGSEKFNATTVNGRRVPTTVHLESAGPRRLIDAVPFSNGHQMERVAFDEHPELRLYRVQIPDVEVLVLGWNWDDDLLTEFARRTRPVQESTTLFTDMERAQSAAWTRIQQRKRRRSD